MNAYTIERHTNPPAYIVIATSDFDIEADTPAYYRKLNALLDTEQEPVAVIIDITHKSLSFDELLRGTKGVRDLDTNPYNHPNNKSLILVSSSRLMQLSLDGFRMLGVVKEIHMAKTVQAALEMA